MIKAEWTSNNALSAEQVTQTNASNTLNALDCISRQAAIDVEGIDEQIRCEMCENPMHTDRGCDGNCRYDEKLYERIMQILGERIKPLPSAQPEVIRCTECKHYREYDSKYVENAVVVQCMADRYPISETIPDGWFCAGAERRQDE